MSFSRFANAPVSNANLALSTAERSTFPKRWSYKTTFNFGDLIPIHWEMIYPGDSLDQSRTAVLARMSTPLFPVMDNAYIDFYYFFCPMRLVWDHWKEMFGENNTNAWTQTATYSVPTMPPIPDSLTDLHFTPWDYYGLSTSIGSGSSVPDGVSSLPFRAYRLIWNEWFRNQNVSAPLLVNTGDSETDLTYYTTLKVSRFHDYFSDCLPAPQKGPDTLIPGLANASVTTSSMHSNSGVHPAMVWRTASGGVPATKQLGANAAGASIAYGSPTITSSEQIYPSNLVIDATNPGYTISALRTAFQIQKILERDARSGSRYTEYIRAAFHTVSPDARLQRPEFLGTSRMPLNVSQVLQTSSSDSTSPLGQTGAVSKTSHVFSVPRKGFTEHGMIVVLAAARTERSYQERIDRKWSCLTRFDFFDPALAHISEQPVYVRELFCDENSDLTYDRVFGYNEAWQFLRQNSNTFTGSFRSDASGTLDSWHYGDVYSVAPTLSEPWMLESPTQVARTLAVTDTVTSHDQILMDVFFDWRVTTSVPVHSIPGLVDHF